MSDQVGTNTDYGSMNVHLAYSLIGENYHALYDPLDGPYSVPGFSDYSRDIFKKALLISLSAARKLSAKRAIRAQWRKDFEKYQYEGIDPETGYYQITDVNELDVLLRETISAGIASDISYAITSNLQVTKLMTEKYGLKF